MVICLEHGADLHTAQLMPLPLTAFCFSKIQIGFTSLVLAHLGSPRQRAIKCVCVCVCVCVLCMCVCIQLFCWHVIMSPGHYTNIFNGWDCKPCPLHCMAAFIASGSERILSTIVASGSKRLSCLLIQIDIFVRTLVANWPWMNAECVSMNSVWIWNLNYDQSSVACQGYFTGAKFLKHCKMMLVWN